MDTARIRRMMLGGLSILVALVMAYLLGGIVEKRKRDLVVARAYALEAQLADCRAGYVKAETARQSLAEEVVFLTQSVSLEKEACAQLSLTLSESEREMSDLREQVAFYRAIVSPSEAKAGVQVHRLALEPVGDGIYGFAVTLLQAVQGGKSARGKLDMRFVGIVEGITKVLRLSEILVAEKQDLSYEFRYFKDLYGEFRLPPGFEPLRVVVIVNPRGIRDGKVSQTFAWTEVINR